MKVWCFAPQSGGVKIPRNSQIEAECRIKLYEQKQSWHPRFQLKTSYKGHFCYLYASGNGQEAFPIGRLRHFSINNWSLAFYTYSNETYQPCVFSNGEWFGTVEQAIDVCVMHLD